MLFFEVLLSDCFHDFVTFDFVFHFLITCIVIWTQKRARLLREWIYPSRNNFGRLWSLDTVQELMVLVCRRDSLRGLLKDWLAETLQERIRGPHLDIAGMLAPVGTAVLSLLLLLHLALLPYVDFELVPFWLSSFRRE